VGDSITFNASGVNPESGDLAASATFEISGSQLIITLTNTGPTAYKQSDLLAGVFFDLADVNELERVSATLVGDYAVVYGDGVTPFEAPEGYENLLPDVGTEWAAVVNQTDDDPLLLDGTSFRGAQYGISVNGYGPFGPDNRFETTLPAYVLDHPSSPDGSNFGMASSIGPEGINGILDTPIVVGGSVQFVFNVTGALSTADISNVNFQYGTDADKNPNIQNGVVPEPSTMSLLGLGIAGFMAMAKMRRKHA
jgi:hypothetical protein